MMKLSDYVFDHLARRGVRDVFLLPGGGSMHLVDSLGRNKDLKFVCCLHEQAAAIAAEAYGQYTNGLGVALVTTGPGGTNALTGVAGAWIDSVPLLVLSGQVKRADLIGRSGVRQMGVQEVDIASIVAPVTKYAVTVTDPDTIRHHIEKAVHVAKSGRPGPVWIDIPLDVQGALVDPASLPPFLPGGPEEPTDGATLPQKVADVVESLNAALRPVILAGNGIRLAGAEREFRLLAKRLGVPVLTTWRVIDFFPEDDDLYFGRPGAIGQRGANFIQQNADLLICIGARLDLGQTGYNHANFARGARKVIVDVDPAEIAKLKMTIDIPVVADAKAFLAEMLRNAGSVRMKDLASWRSLCRNWKDRYPLVPEEFRTQNGFVNTYVLVEALSESMSAGDVLVPGSSGSCSEITLQSFKVKAGQRILNSPGLGAMGFGLPESIGACIASGGKRTVTVVGDGGFQLNIQELETIRRLDLPIKIFVLNNDGYASIRNTQRNYFRGHYVACDPSCGLTLPETRRIADAYRIPFSAIATHEGIGGKVRDVLAADGPRICEVMVDPMQPTLPRITSEVRPDGTIVSKPLEDLWPFLDREEFRANMIVPPVDEDPPRP